jgi:hypothetical protein
LRKTTTAKTRKISVIASILPSIAKAFEPVPQPGHVGCQACDNQTPAARFR